MDKTLEQLFEEIKGSEKLQQELRVIAEAQDVNALQKWIGDQGCGASVSEAKQFLIAKKEEAGDSDELTPEELEQAAGGFWPVLLFTADIVGTLIGAGVEIAWKKNDCGPSAC